MKLKLLLPFATLLGLALSAQAQITLDASNAPVIGNVLHYATDTLPQNVEIGTGGANQTWDFSSLQAHVPSSVGIIAPSEAANGDDFPTASFAQVLDDGSYGFASLTSEGVFALGASLDFFGNDNFLSVHFDPVQQVYAFPTTYGTTFSGPYAFSITIDGSDFDVDSIRFVSEAEQTVTTDGYGTLITPEGSFDALRQSIETVTETTIFALFFGTWLPLDSSVDTTMTYQWLTAEAKGQALTVEVFDGAITGATWFQSADVTVQAPVALFTITPQDGGEVQFTDQSTNNPTSWSWTFGDNTTSTDQNPSHTYTVSGTYEVCLTAANSGGSSTNCQDVTVTIVSAGETANPLALKVYPNPAGNWLTFDAEGNILDNFSLHILNLMGQEVLNTTLEGKRIIDLSSFAKGQYLYLLRDGNGRPAAEGRFEKQ